MRDKEQGMEERAAAYERLAYCFLARPDKSFMNGMVTTFSSDESAPWSKEFGAFAARIAEVGEDAALQELSVDRTRLFKGLTPDGPTPPYQSMFRKEKRSDSLAQISGLYHKAGFDSASIAQDAPDQLGIELMFMAYLLRRCSVDGGDHDKWFKWAKAFFENNLEPFALSFAGVMASEARTCFFRGYATLLECFIHEEAELMDQA